VEKFKVKALEQGHNLGYRPVSHQLSADRLSMTRHVAQRVHRLEMQKQILTMSLYSTYKRNIKKQRLNPEQQGYNKPTSI
jgi:hypothetical protein